MNDEDEDKVEVVHIPAVDEEDEIVVANVVNLDGRRPMYGDNWSLAERWLQDVEAELPSWIESLHQAIADRNRGDFLATTNLVIENLFDLRATIRGEEE